MESAKADIDLSREPSSLDSELSLSICSLSWSLEKFDTSCLFNLSKSLYASA